MMRDVNVWIFIGLSVLSVSLRTECTPIEEVKISHIIVEMGKDQVTSEDLSTAASDHHEDTAELSHDNDVGYLKKSEEKGGDGYQHFESFHDKDGDSYGYEKHDAYGKDTKDEGEQGGHYTHESQKDEHDDEEETDEKPVAKGKGKGTAEYGPDKHKSYSYHYDSKDDDGKKTKKGYHTSDDGGNKKKSDYAYATHEDDDESDDDDGQSSGAYSHASQHDGESDGHDEGVEEDDESDDGGQHQSYSYAGNEDEESQEHSADDNDFSPSQYKEDKSRDDFSRFLSDNYKANEEDESTDVDDAEEDEEEDSKASLKKDNDDEDDDDEEEDEEEGSAKSADEKSAPKSAPKATGAIQHTTYHGKPVATSYSVNHGHPAQYHAAPHAAHAHDNGGGHANKVNSNSYESHVVHVVTKKNPAHDGEEHHQAYTHVITPKKPKWEQLKTAKNDGHYQVNEHHDVPAKQAKYTLKNQPTVAAKKYRGDAGPAYSYGQQFVYASDKDFDATY